MAYTYLWYFIIYAFLGWCCEVAFAAFAEGKFVNRGFLNGAVCPIYGFGVCIVYAFLMPFKDTWLTLFVLSMLLTSLLELITGFALDKIFHQRWWDYSANSFNLGGYICLIASLGWGVGCLFVVKVLFPITDKLISLLPKTIGWILLGICLALFVTDTVITLCMMIGLNKYLKKLDSLAKAFREDSDIIGKKVSTGTMEAIAKYNEITAEGTPVSEFVDKSKAVKENLEEFSENVVRKTKEFKDDITEKSREMRLAQRSERKKKVAAGRLSRKNYDEMLSKVTKKYSRLLKAFPNFQFSDFPDQTKQLKKKLRGRKH